MREAARTPQGRINRWFCSKKEDEVKHRNLYVEALSDIS